MYGVQGLGSLSKPGATMVTMASIDPAQHLGFRFMALIAFRV